MKCIVVVCLFRMFVLFLIWFTICLVKTFKKNHCLTITFSSFIVCGGFSCSLNAIFHLQVMFQYSVRHSPLRIDDLLGSVSSPANEGSKACDIEMDG